MRGYTAPAPVHRVRRLLKSSIGAKIAMAVTGLLMLGFLAGHLAGNLLVFSGRDAMNAYAQWLQDHPGLLWTARIVLLAVLLLHVRTGIVLARANRAARPVRYRHEDTIEANFASRTMILTGLLVLAYLVYHLLHFTFHAIDTGGMGRMDAQGRLDVYGMVVSGFQHPAVAISYLVAMGILGIHLWHGVGSLFQTLGLNHVVWNRTLRAIALAVPVLLVAGYIAIPVAIWIGAVS